MTDSGFDPDKAGFRVALGLGVKHDLSHYSLQLFSGKKAINFTNKGKEKKIISCNKMNNVHK